MGAFLELNYNILFKVINLYLGDKKIGILPDFEMAAINDMLSIDGVLKGCYFHWVKSFSAKTDLDFESDQFKMAFNLTSFSLKLLF